MSSLESAADEADSADEPGATDSRESIAMDDPAVELHVPADATNGEAAAIAAVVSAHLTDQQRAAAAAASARESVEYADRWKLTGRFRSVGKRRIPRDIEKGEEWKAVGRAHPR